MTYEAIRGYRHIQTLAQTSTTWTITHELNTMTPAVDCWVDVAGTMTKILPLTVVATDAGTVTLTFSGNQYGEAYVA